MPHFNYTKHTVPVPWMTLQRKADVQVSLHALPFLGVVVLLRHAAKVVIIL